MPFSRLAVSYPAPGRGSWPCRWRAGSTHRSRWSTRLTTLAGCSWWSRVDDSNCPRQCDRCDPFPRCVVQDREGWRAGSSRARVSSAIPHQRSVLREAPSLVGRYIFADYCSGTFWALSRSNSGAWSSELLFQRSNGPTSFGEDEQGNVYFADATAGALYRVADDAPPLVRVVEYYNATLDHYLVTSLPDELGRLDRQVLPGWLRTGLAFTAYAWAAMAVEPVCRFYIPPSQGDSHFYSASPQECAVVAQRFPAFILEHGRFSALRLRPSTGSARSASFLCTGSGTRGRTATTATRPILPFAMR